MSVKSIVVPVYIGWYCYCYVSSDSIWKIECSGRLAPFSLCTVDVTATLTYVMTRPGLKHVYMANPTLILKVTAQDFKKRTSKYMNIKFER
jgi:hypothetical protein